MTNCILLEEALDQIVSSILNTIGCDKAFCYVVDQSKGELWSKSFGLNSVRRCAMNEGVSGYVVTHRETVNILNAQSDKRFNDEFDS